VNRARCRRFRAICYASIDSGVSDLIFSSNVWTARNAVIGAVLVTLITCVGLAGCGRKGGLDPPPVAAPVDERGVPIQPAVAPESAPNG
jgi:predicted small lipoprotein YifL